MAINNTNIFSESYNELETFLKTITDPKGRYKVNWIHASMPKVNAQSFEGYPFMVLKINVDESNPAFDTSISQKNFRAFVTIYSDQPTDIESVCDSIFSTLRSSTTLTFGIKKMEASPINWTLDQNGKKILFREIQLELINRI